MTRENAGALPGQFAAGIKEGRIKAGLRQSELAERAGLTAAYVSQLESGRKPPPSDEVVARIAAALALDPQALLETAHFDKTPSDVRRKFSALDARLKRQSGLASRIIGDMLPLTLFNFLKTPGYLDYALRGRKVSSEGRAVLDRLKGQVGSVGNFTDFRRDSRRALNGLAEKEREELVEALQALADWEGARPPAAGGDADGRLAEIPVFDRPPPAPAAAHAAGSVGVLSVAASSWKSSKWALAVRDEANFPKIEKGDLVIFDEKIMARAGDVVAALIEPEGFVVGRYLKRPSEIEIAPVNPSFPPRCFGRDRDTHRPFTLRGVAVELVRRLRP